MKLIIFPGSSDPNIDTGKEIYDLIRENAMKRGFSDTQVVTYLGHYSHGKYGNLSVKSATNTISDKLSELEDKQENYVIVARSFGCYPLLEVIKKMDLQFCKKATLWGAPPYYLFFYHFVENWKHVKEKEDEKGCRFGDFFHELVPIEISIEHHLRDKKLTFDLVITSGELDVLYPECHRETLLSLCKNPRIFFPERMKGLGHKVTEFNEAYLNLLLNCE